VLENALRVLHQHLLDLRQSLPPLSGKRPYNEAILFVFPW
jgi:hypothetical protein